jgi:hypothetical protein
MTRHAILLLCLALAGVFVGRSAQAQTQQFHAILNGASEVPPTSSGATGTLTAVLNEATNQLSYELMFQGLTGSATAAHFHGPAAIGANAAVVLPIGGASVSSPVKSEANLSAQQVADLLAGKWYANVHTAANPSGEIRGQVLPTE